jgi:hypothetical protein
VGLVQEPFVAGADTMIDRLVADILTLSSVADAQKHCSVRLASAAGEPH